MKNKNKRELEKLWKTEAAKKRKAAKKTTRREEVNQAAARIVKEATEEQGQPESLSGGKEPASSA